MTGDVTAATVKAAVEKALAAWPAGGSKPAFTYPALPKPAATTIYLVDKPGAAQSTFAIGLPGPARDTKDYYALEVMNTMLGGLFQSRLNANIREEKGLSYGVNSSFAFGRGPGAVPRRRRHHFSEVRRGPGRVHEGTEGHRRQPAGDRRGTEDGEGRTGAEPAGAVRVGQRHQRGDSNAGDRRAAGYVLPAVRRGGRGGHRRPTSCASRSSTSISITWRL